MERKVGNTFSFNLNLHGKQKKQSHAVDTWMMCEDCFYTCVHGVAIPDKVYEDFYNRFLFALRKKGKKRSEIEEKILEGKMEFPNALLMMPKDEDKEIKMDREPRWQETNDKVGFTPLFKIDCKMCGYPMMFVRHTKLALARKVIKPRWLIRQVNKALKFVSIKFVIMDDKAQFCPVNRMAYKCPRCDWLATFLPPMRDSYFKYILHLRHDRPLYYPTIKEWKSEDELIKLKLEDMGYV